MYRTCFLIRKNPGSTENPWLGTFPLLSAEEMFATITDFFLLDGKLSAFHKPEEAFAHIRKNHPQDVGVAQVYKAEHNSDPKHPLVLTHVPWPS